MSFSIETSLSLNYYIGVLLFSNFGYLASIIFSTSFIDFITNTFAFGLYLKSSKSTFGVTYTFITPL